MPLSRTPRPAAAPDLPPILSPADRLVMFNQWRRLALKLALDCWLHPGRQTALRHAGLDLEDLQQLALMALWRAAEQYDPARGIQYSTYGGAAVRNALLSIMARASRRPALAQIAGDVEPADSTEPDAAMQAAEQAEANRQLAAQIRAMLPPRRRRALELRAAGATLEQIGLELGVCKERVRQLLMSARTLVRRRFAAGA